MKETKLTPDQVAALAPYERFFGPAIRSSWCSYPGQAGIDLMLDTWKAVTGSPRNYRQGCGNCILSLVKDVGTLYFAAAGIDPFAAKRAEIAAAAAESVAASTGQSKPKTAKTAPKKGNKTAKR